MIFITGWVTNRTPKNETMDFKIEYLNVFGSAWQEVSNNISDLTKSGLLAANRMPTNPPIERPTK